MSDLIHSVELTDNGFKCIDCGIDVPSDIAILGDDVIEFGGSGVHWIPSMAYDGKAKSCVKGKRSNALIVCLDCDGSGCSKCSSSGVVSSDGSIVETAPNVEHGDTVEILPKITDFEKNITRAGVNNFVMLREATRPQ